MNATVQDNPDRSRFEIHVDGEVAGFAEYVRGDGVLDLTHTEVGEDHAGEGLAGQLAETAFAAARDEGLAVLPHCSYMAKYAAKHPELIDLVPEDRREEFGLTDTAGS